ncbi:MAG: hypothetical protein IKF36_05440 [Bacilli bacterium]|nr:hypothetical protein [Bacilli bacterium]
MKKIRIIIFSIILITALIIVYGFYLGTSGMIAKEYLINETALPESFNNFKIGHFADILYDDKDDLEHIKNAVNKINDKKVDLVIFSGGLLKKNHTINEEENNEIISELKKIKSKYGKYYVSGKDDKTNQSYDAIMQASGFISLNDNVDTITSKKNESILLIGFDNNSNLEFTSDKLSGKENMYKISIFHESDFMEEIENYKFNLAFSSNSLNGQINIPIIKKIFLDSDSSNYYSDYYEVNNTKLYISSGIGNRTIDFRLFNKPSVNIYVLKKM